MRGIGSLFLMGILVKWEKMINKYRIEFSKYLLRTSIIYGFLMLITLSPLDWGHVWPILPVIIGGLILTYYKSGEKMKFSCVIEDHLGRISRCIDTGVSAESIRKRLFDAGFNLLSIEPAGNQLTFGIDFDGTFAADPVLFRDMLLGMIKRGHNVVFVTGRSDDSRKMGDVVRELVNETFSGDNIEFPIIFAGTEWKDVAAKNAGYNVNIWIDDNPQWIGSQEIKGGENNE